jgi:hypothetical protein
MVKVFQPSGYIQNKSLYSTTKGALRECLDETDRKPLEDTVPVGSFLTDLEEVAGISFLPGFVVNDPTLSGLVVLALSTV